MASSSPPPLPSSSSSVDHGLLPAVREAQGLLLRSIFGHAAFDGEGERMRGKLFYVFEETLAVNDALELAHLGDDADGQVRAALDRALELDGLIAAGDPHGQLLDRARRKYGDDAADRLRDTDLGDDITRNAAAVRDAALKVLGKAAS